MHSIHYGPDAIRGFIRGGNALLGRRQVERHASDRLPVCIVRCVTGDPPVQSAARPPPCSHSIARIARGASGWLPTHSRHTKRPRPSHAQQQRFQGGTGAGGILFLGRGLEVGADKHTQFDIDGSMESVRFRPSIPISRSKKRWFV